MMVGNIFSIDGGNNVIFLKVIGNMIWLMGENDDNYTSNCLITTLMDKQKSNYRHSCLVKIIPSGYYGLLTLNLGHQRC